MQPALQHAFQPKGPFDLSNQNQFFGGWPLLRDGRTIAMAFPVEGWRSSAVITLSQNTDESIAVSVYGAADPEKAMAQALAAMSLDEDGTGWQAIGQHDQTLKELQVRYSYLRPSLFYSPYEAASHFLIGHRISMAQGRKIRQQMAHDFGEKLTVDGQDFYAFPSPEKLLTITEYPGLNATKIERLHMAAQAALDGWLDRTALRQMDEAAALEKIETLPGVGRFFSQGILERGVGIADGFTHDDLTYHAIGMRYHLGESPSEQEVLRIAEEWRPYRMWAVVLHHIWLRQTGNLPKRTFSKR